MLKQFRLPLLLLFLPAVLFVFFGGCESLKKNKDKDKDPAHDYKIETEDGKPKLIKDCAFVGNYQSILVQGFGLVIGLPGTGGEDANTYHYQKVYEDLNQQGVSGIRSLLARPDTAVVELRGLMRPGIQRGDRFDVEVILPTETSTKSLQGGRLVQTKLVEMAVFEGNKIAEGDTRAIVEGPIMVNDPLATEISNPAGLKKGTILSGAVTRTSRSLSLITKDDARSVFITDRIARAINHRFYMPTGARKGVADAKDHEIIEVEVHPDYANDIPRYVRVLQSIACFENSASPQQAKRIERLKEEVLHPETAQEAAFQLEAIGKAGIEPLRQALRSSNMAVRFHAATSLAYLGDGTTARVLAEIVQREPAFRVYALNALSVMKNDGEAEQYLQELLHAPEGETRYGAFRALKTRNPLDQTIRGEMLGGHGGQFSYHGISSRAVPMVHYTTQKYPEIVLFGTDIFLRQPFALDAGATIYVNGQTQGGVVVSNLANPTGIDERRWVSNRLDEIIRAVVELGGTYPDVVRMLRQADRDGVLSCRLEIDCLPAPNREYRQSGGDSEQEYVEEEKPKTFWERMNPKNIFPSNSDKKTSNDRSDVDATQL